MNPIDDRKDDNPAGPAGEKRKLTDAEIKKRLDDLEDEMNKFPAQVDALSRQLAALDEKATEQGVQLAALDEKAKEQDVQLAALQQQINELKPAPPPADPDPAVLADQYRKLDLTKTDNLKNEFNAQKEAVLIAVARLLNPDADPDDKVLTAMYKYVKSPALMARLAAAAGKPDKA